MVSTVPKYQFQNMVYRPPDNFGTMLTLVIWRNGSYHGSYHVFIVRCCPDCGPDYRAVLRADVAGNVIKYVR